MRESVENALNRWKLVELLQGHYREFVPFLEDGMNLLGFEATEIQKDIGSFMAYGPQYLMVQAQRDQAKTTIVALFAVWCLIHNPKLRILVVSGGESLANQISKLIIQVIMQWELLECLRPDPSAGDRISVEAFDVHHSLKGIDKSPSIACVGVTGNFTGYRSDLLLADDVETPKNSFSAAMREQILERTREFINLSSAEGRILYLGTPQVGESIYNTLPARGFTVRVWPGRYPTPDQMKHYGEYLAPIIVNRIARDPSLQTGGGVLGDQGKPIDTRLNESVQQAKELDNGTARYQMQYMLNTSLSDKSRYPLKSGNLIILASSLDNKNGSAYPMAITRHPMDGATISKISAGFTFKVSPPASVTEEYRPFTKKILYIDPAAGGTTSRDETGFAVLGYLNGNVFLTHVGGIPGGYELSKMEELADIALEHNVDLVIIEKNMGWGGFKEVFSPVLYGKHRCGLEDHVVSGQKEKRIIEILGPVIGRGSLIILPSAIESDDHYCQAYEAKDKKIYSLFFQMNHITESKKALVHDDRLDALAGAVHHFMLMLSLDQKLKLEAEEKKAFQEWIKDPTGVNKILAGYNKKMGPQRGPNILRRRR